jgi:hypothetical protein
MTSDDDEPGPVTHRELSLGLANGPAKSAKTVLSYVYIAL